MEIKKQSTTLENFMDYEQYKNSNPNTDFMRKTFYQWQWKKMQETGFSNSFLKTISILIFFSVFLSCKSLYNTQYKYYVYESEKKNEQGLPMQYYALLYNDPHFIKLRFSDYTNCDSGTIIEISTTEKDAFFFWIDSSLTTNVSLVQDTIFRKLYFVEEQKATLRFKYSKQQFYELSRKIIDESDDYTLKENFNTFCLWFPPEMKRVKKIDESKFPKRSMKVMKKFFNK